MNRVFFLMILLLSSAQFVQTQGLTLYRSNPLGLRLERVNEIGDHPYILEVTRSGDAEVEVLRSATETLRSTTRQFSGGTVIQETVVENGEVSVRREYDGRGRLLLERDSTLQRRFRYGGGRLAEMVVTDANGQIIHTESYAYTEEGRLREAVKTLADGSRTIILYNFADGRLIEELVQKRDEVTLNRFDQSGLLTHRERRDADGELLSRTVFGYGNDGGTIRSSRRENYIDDTVLDRVFDTEGRVVFEDQTGSHAYTTRYTYDLQGNKVSERKTGARGLEEWAFTYDADGELLSEQYRLRGALQRIRTHTGERQWHDDLYRQDKAVLRVYYENDEKTGEERL